MIAPLLLLLAPLLPPQDTSGTGQEPIFFDEGDTYILQFDEQGEGVDLESLTKLCQKATGTNFTYDQQTAQTLQQTKVKIFGQKRIPKSEFYSFYQIIMFIHQFVCTTVGDEPLSLVVIQQLQTVRQQGSNLQSEAIYVMPEEIDKYASQVATPIMTVLHLPHTETRQLQNSLRALFPETGAQSSNVVSVGNTNSVIIKGFASKVAALVRILKLVDAESAKDTGVSPEFDVIPLQFAAAQDIADQIEQLLEASRRVQERNRASQAAQGATGNIQQGGGESKILVDNRTNSLLVMALPEDMVDIRELIARLDVDVIEPDRTYNVIALENVAAEELAEVLESFIQDASRVTSGAAGSGRVQPGGAGGGQTGATSRDAQVAVVPDPVTNSLLIAASKTRFEELQALISRLDRRQSQVLIETALIELAGTSFRDIGVELAFADVPDVGESGGFGATQFGLSTLSDTNGDGVPDIRLPNLTNGITAGILDGDDINLPILIAAIQDVRDSNVLNVPSVLVNNNGSALVESLDKQPTTTITLGTGGAAATQENFNGYEEAGITMRISPSISASGYLRLNVYLKVSVFQGSFSGPIPPPQTERIIETSVNVPDGDTMVIGGIVTDNKTFRRRSTPGLGDIPIVGALFRRDEKTNDRITLYFFVTPHILEDKDFADLAQVSYDVKLQAAEKIGADRIRMVDPNFGQSSDKVDLSGFEVPLYRSPERGEVDPEDAGIDPLRQQELLDQSQGTENAPSEPAEPVPAESSEEGAPGGEEPAEGSASNPQ